MVSGESAKKNEQNFVLIVEDEPDLRNIIGIHANAIGISPRFASNGKEALEVLETQATDFIISDMLMPEMNGLALLEEIRNRGSFIPFLVLSGHGDKELVLACLRLGAFDYLEKPFDNSALKSLMMEALKIAAAENSVAGSSRLLSLREDLNGENEKRKTKFDEYAVARLKILSQSKVGDVAEATPKIDSDLSREQMILKNFLVESFSQLENTEKAMRSLSSSDPNNWELGYMNRVMNGLLAALDAVNQNEIRALVRGMNQCFSLYRIRTSMLAQRELNILKRAHKILMLKIKSLREELEGKPPYPMSEDIKSVIADLRSCISH
ncbi:MAG: response regulator [Oligoflexales bacterium]